MIFLAITDIPACQLPIVLEIIYFCKLIFNIIHIILPIGLIIFCMVDFTKCIITGDESEQSKKSKLVFKRILYAVLVFAVPYIVSLGMSILSDMVPDYNLCITNATPTNIAVFTKKYEKEKELEKQERSKKLEEKKGAISGNIDSANFYEDYASGKIENLKQSDSRWKDFPVCSNVQWGGNNNNTIASSGCGYVAYTMVLRSFGFNDVLPSDIVTIACKEYHHTDSIAYPEFLISPLLNDRYGLKGKMMGSSLNDIPAMEQALRDGKKLIINIPGHYISILGIDDNDKIAIGDSIRGLNGTGKYTLYTLYEHVVKYSNSGNHFLNVSSYEKK